MAPAQPGDHADRLLPAARIERAVVDVLNNLREGVKREIWACTIWGHDSAAISAPACAPHFLDKTVNQILWALSSDTYMRLLQEHVIQRGHGQIKVAL